MKVSSKELEAKKNLNWSPESGKEHATDRFSLYIALKCFYEHK